jgi:DeoR family transcriptional regulator, suf operon transcriptional repressor
MATTSKPSLPRGATRRKILSTLKKSDGLTADQLAGLLGITSMAVRKHLAALESDELIESTLERRAIGRPANLYRVAPLAEDFFPKHYDMVVTELLSDLVQIDGERKVNLLLERRAERTCEFLRERIGHAKTLGERVAALTEGMDELGYLAVWEQCDESTYFIKQYNCAINRVAACFPIACNYEAQMFRQLLDADVERASHVLAGDHLCGYVIRARTPLGNAATSDRGCSCTTPS